MKNRNDKKFDLITKITDHIPEMQRKIGEKISDLLCINNKIRDIRYGLVPKNPAELEDLETQSQLLTIEVEEELRVVKLLQFLQLYRIQERAHELFMGFLSLTGPTPVLPQQKRTPKLVLLSPEQLKVGYNNVSLFEKLLNEVKDIVFKRANDNFLIQASKHLVRPIVVHHTCHLRQALSDAQPNPLVVAANNASARYPLHPAAFRAFLRQDEIEKSGGLLTVEGRMEHTRLEDVIIQAFREYANNPNLPADIRKHNQLGANIHTCIRQLKRVFCVNKFERQDLLNGMLRLEALNKNLIEFERQDLLNGMLRSAAIEDVKQTERRVKRMQN